jgi:hypothetical protein
VVSFEPRLFSAVFLIFFVSLSHYLQELWSWKVPKIDMIPANETTAVKVICHRAARVPVPDREARNGVVVATEALAVITIAATQAIETTTTRIIVTEITTITTTTTIATEISSAIRIGTDGHLVVSITVTINNVISVIITIGSTTRRIHVRVTIAVRGAERQRKRMIVPGHVRIHVAVDVVVVVVEGNHDPVHVIVPVCMIPNRRRLAISHGHRSVQ